MTRDAGDVRRFWRAMFDSMDQLLDEAFHAQCGDDEAVGRITLREKRVLKKVDMLTEDRPEGITLKELSEALSLSPGTVSEIVAKMVDVGVLDRETSPADRRAVSIRISKRGREHQERGRSYVDGVVTPFLNSLNAEERQFLTEKVEEFNQFVNQRKK